MITEAQKPFCSHMAVIRLKLLYRQDPSFSRVKSKSLLVSPIVREAIMSSKREEIASTLPGMGGGDGGEELKLLPGLEFVVIFLDCGLRKVLWFSHTERRLGLEQLLFPAKTIL